MVTRTRQKKSLATKHVQEYDEDIELSEPDLGARMDDEIEHEYEYAGEEDGNDDDEEEDYLPAKSKKQKLNNRKLQSKRSSSYKNGKTKQLSSNIDEVEDFIENFIFKSLSSNELAPSELAQLWITEFSTTTELNKKFSALKDLLNFLLRCSGCLIQLTENDVINADNARDTISEIQKLFEQQKFHEFPLLYSTVTSNKTNKLVWSEFNDNFVSFISQIIVIANETGILYDEEEEFVELLLEWVSALSTSNARPLRYVATLFGLTVQSVFCKISVNISKFIDKFLRQLKKESEILNNLLDSEKKTKKLSAQVLSTNEKIDLINNNLTLYKNKKTLIDNYIENFFNTIFVHRYRDVSHEIRLICVRNLNDWILDYPEYFFQTNYLRYLGWLLSDQHPTIRAENLKVLLNLFKNKVLVQPLRQFISYFKSKLIDVLIYEIDFNTRYNCLLLLTEILNKNYLNDDDVIKLTSLLFIDDEDLVYPMNFSTNNKLKFFKELSKMLLNYSSAKTKELLENEINDEIDLTEIDALLPHSYLTLLNLKQLAGILKESYDYYLLNYSAKEIKLNQYNSKIFKFKEKLQFIYQNRKFNDSNRIFEALLSFLTFDFSSIQVPAILKDSLELNSDDQIILLHLINSSSVIMLDADNQFFKFIFSGHSKTPNFNDQNYYILQLLNKLPEIMRYFNNNIEVLSIVMNLLNTVFSNLDSVLTNSKNKENLNELIKLLLNYFKIINFPIVEFDLEKDSRFYDSVSSEYITFFKSLNINEFKLESQIDLLFNELMIILESNLDNEEELMFLLNKTYIMSHLTYIKTSLFSKLSDLIDNVKISEENEKAMNVMLNCYNNFVLETLKIAYETKSTSYFKSINFIQRTLEDLIDEDIFSNLKSTNDLIICYLDNLINISTLKLSSDLAYLVSDIKETTVSKVLQLFQILEYQNAQFLNNSDQIDHDVDDVINFDGFSIFNEHNDDATAILENTELRFQYELKLYKLTTKLLILSSNNLDVLPDEVKEKIDSRIRKNHQILSPLFNRILESFKELTNETDSITGNNLKQAKLPVKETDATNGSESEAENISEDENDPIENSDNELVEDDENLEFSSDIEETLMSNDNSNRPVNAFNKSSQISMASSFPFTQ